MLVAAGRGPGIHAVARVSLRRPGEMRRICAAVIDRTGRICYSIAQIT